LSFRKIISSYLYHYYQIVMTIMEPEISFKKLQTILIQRCPVCHTILRKIYLWILNWILRQRFGLFTMPYSRFPAGKRLLHIHSVLPIMLQNLSTCWNLTDIFFPKCFHAENKYNFHSEEWGISKFDLPIHFFCFLD